MQAWQAWTPVADGTHCPGGNQFVCGGGICHCEPACEGKLCGDDGCGGVCGECDDGLNCTQDDCLDAACVFTPMTGYCVIGQTCASEGTEKPGNSCQSCQPDTTPVGWSAIEDGVPCAGSDLHHCEFGECLCFLDCGGAECGDDGCGGSCGECKVGQPCQSGSCVGPKFSWHMGLAKSNKILGLAVLPGGDIIIGGTFNLPPGDSINLGGDDLVSSGADDIFLARFKQDGTHVWSKSWGGAKSDNLLEIVIDNDGSILFAGTFASDALDLGGPVLANPTLGASAYLARVDGQGAHLMSVGFSAGKAAPMSLATEPAGSIYIGGYVTTAMDFGGGEHAFSGSMDGFVLKVSGNGKHVWSKVFGGIDTDSIRGVVGLSDGSVVAAGNLKSDEVVIDGVALENTTPGENDLMLMRIDSSGQTQWAQNFGGQGNDYTTALCVLPNDDVVVGGWFNSSEIGFGESALLLSQQDDDYASAGDVFLAQFDQGGNHLWSTAFGGPKQDYVNFLAVAKGVLLMAGYFGSSSLNPGGGGLDNSSQDGALDLWVGSFGTDGAHLWSAAFGGESSEYVDAFGAGENGRLYLSGKTKGTVDFGGGELPKGDFLLSFSY